MVFAILCIRKPCFKNPTVNNSSQKSMQTMTWKQAPTKTQNFTHQNSKSSQNGIPKSLKITKNLSCQKTESTIVLAMLQSTGKSKVVFSHKRGTENAS